MSSLTSSSTLAEVQAAYVDTASYAEDDSTEKAALFITACRILLLKLPKRSVAGGRGGQEIELDPTLIRDEMRAAGSWLASSAAAADGSRVRFASFGSFRD